MKCVVCKVGETRSGTTTVTLERDETVIVFRNVPAEVCDNCGERYLSEEVTAQLLSLAEEAYRDGVQVAVQAFRFLPIAS